MSCLHCEERKQLLATALVAVRNGDRDGYNTAMSEIAALTKSDFSEITKRFSFDAIRTLFRQGNNQ